MFLIEGGLTLLIGIASFYMMPPSPTQTRAWYRPNGWFTERYVMFPSKGRHVINSMHDSEETIIVNRVLRDDPAKSDMHNREGLSVLHILHILKDWRMWPLYILGLTHMSKWGFLDVKRVLTFWPSPRESATDLPYPQPSPPRLQHDPVEPSYHSFDGARDHWATGYLLPKRSL